MTTAEKTKGDRLPLLPTQAGLPLPGSERRKSTRYVPVVRLIEVGWWEGSVFRTATAYLCDISYGGAAVVTNATLPDQLPLWIFLPSLAETEWVQARVVGFTTDERRILRTRLQFTGFCPYSLFKMLVWGIDAPEPARRMQDFGEGAVLVHMLDGPATTGPRADIAFPLPPSRCVLAARPAGSARAEAGMIDHDA